jgi:hypothetical protein
MSAGRVNFDLDPSSARQGAVRAQEITSLEVDPVRAMRYAEPG